MTKNEYKEKYPAGTKVKYIGYSNQNSEITKDVGKVGKIVGTHWNNPIIFLPESEHISTYSTEQMPASWETAWEYLEILPRENEQLVFAFME